MMRSLRGFGRDERWKSGGRVKALGLVLLTILLFPVLGCPPGGGGSKGGVACTPGAKTLSWDLRYPGAESATGLTPYSRQFKEPTGYDACSGARIDGLRNAQLFSVYVMRSGKDAGRCGPDPAVTVTLGAGAATTSNDMMAIFGSLHPASPQLIIACGAPLGWNALPIEIQYTDF